MSSGSKGSKTSRRRTREQMLKKLQDGSKELKIRTYWDYSLLIYQGPINYNMPIITTEQALIDLSALVSVASSVSERFSNLTSNLFESLISGNYLLGHHYTNNIIYLDFSDPLSTPATATATATATKQA